MKTQAPLAFDAESPYRQLAEKLNELPNGFPSAQDESELRLLAKIFTPEEAALAAGLRPDLETPDQVAARLGRDPGKTTALLRQMVKKGQIVMGKTDQGRLGFGLMPFVVGIYEAQAGRIDVELAELFEDYYRAAFGEVLKVKPQLHRVIPVRESIDNSLEVQPYESVSDLVEKVQSWGVIDCICRTQKALIGQACTHPLDVCMVLSGRPDAFLPGGNIRPLTREQAHETLQRAANAGLVHCVSNNQHDTWYICNCCTCSCGILRGMADLGVANVVARSAFLNSVDEGLCAGCGECIAACQFGALTIEASVVVNETRCVGCGVCVPVCPQGALSLVRRREEELPPLNDAAWRQARQAARQCN